LGSAENFIEVKKFVSEKDLSGVTSCTTTADYIDYYVEQYNTGKLGIQPHNFVIIDGEQIKVEPIEIKIERLLNPTNNFDWLTSQTNYIIKNDRSYRYGVQAYFEMAIIFEVLDRFILFERMSEKNK